MCYLCRSSGGTSYRTSSLVPLPVAYRHWWLQHVKILRSQKQNIVAYASSSFSIKGIVIVLPDFNQCILHTSDFMRKCVKENYDVYVMEPFRAGIYDCLLNPSDQRNHVNPNVDEYYNNFVDLLQLIQLLGTLQDVEAKNYTQKKGNKVLLNKYSASELPIYVYAKGLGCVVAARYIALKGSTILPPAIYLDNAKDVSIKSYYFCNERTDYWNVVLWTAYTWLYSLFGSRKNSAKITHILDDRLLASSKLQARVLGNLYRLPEVAYHSCFNITHQIYTHACALVTNCSFT